MDLFLSHYRQNSSVDWDITDSTTNLNEGQHHWTNQKTGVKLSFYESIEHARIVDFKTAPHASSEQISRTAELQHQYDEAKVALKGLQTELSAAKGTTKHKHSGNKTPATDEPLLQATSSGRVLSPRRGSTQAAAVSAELMTAPPPSITDAALPSSEVSPSSQFANSTPLAALTSAVPTSSHIVDLTPLAPISSKVPESCHIADAMPHAPSQGGLTAAHSGDPFTINSASAPHSLIDFEFRAAELELFFASDPSYSDVGTNQVTANFNTAGTSFGFGDFASPLTPTKYSSSTLGGEQTFNAGVYKGLIVGLCVLDRHILTFLIFFDLLSASLIRSSLISSDPT
ncbi:hypothetical protein B0H12DRAFT_1225388 [Mycena haematopus]|nr:hypothetical protein B0H12DRAFT_1225388 [Mycena haematopus]